MKFSFGLIALCKVKFVVGVVSLVPISIKIVSLVVLGAVVLARIPELLLEFWQQLTLTGNNRHINLSVNVILVI